MLQTNYILCVTIISNVVAAVILSSFPHVVMGNADSDATPSIVDDLLTTNRAARPEPFLDRIAALFGGGNKPSTSKGQITSNLFVLYK